MSKEDRFFLRHLQDDFCNGIYDKEIDRKISPYSIVKILNYFYEKNPKKIEDFLVHERICHLDDDYKYTERYEDEEYYDWYEEDIPWCKNRCDKYPWWREYTEDEKDSF